MSTETTTTEEDIRLRAFYRRHRRGRPHGYEVAFGLQAERELEGERIGRPALPDGDFVTSGTGADCCR